MSKGEGGRVARRGGEHKLCEGWLEHKTNSQNPNQKWKSLWVVLKSNIIYIFADDDTIQDNQIGNLTVDQDTSFVNIDKGDHRRGYKFDLRTGKRLNRFKTKTSSQREEWRAFILGMATGHVPSDIDLLPREITRMQADIDAILKGAPLNRQSTYSGGSLESGIVSDIVSGLSDVNIPYQSSPSGSTASSSNTTQLDMGGPVMVHRFYPDRFDQRVPSWFFHKCPRHTAETILLNTQDYGNTLMRESSTHKDNGSYVISKSFLNSSSNRMEIEHYEVMRVATGYRINVENVQPEMTNLTAVMDYFVSTTGGTAHLMTTNDMRTLGMQEPDYETRCIRGIPEPPPEPWVWPPPDYDDVRPAQRPAYRPSDAKTVTAGILKNKYSPSNTGSPGSRWSVGNGPQSPRTIANFSRPHSENPRLDELQQRVHQTDTLRALDDAIDGGFEHNSVYINVGQDSAPPPLPHKPVPHAYVNEEDNHPVAQPPPIPPPPAHQSAPQSYVNQPSSKDHDDVTLRSLPEAPPPPTYRKNRNSVTSPPPAPPPPASPLKHQGGSLSINTNQRVTVQAGQFVKPQPHKTQSEGVIRNTPKSPGSPASFPTWTDPKPATKNIIGTPKNDTPKTINNANGTNDSAETSGIDDTNPGGVSDLKSRFEKSPPVKSPLSPKPSVGGPVGRGSLASTRPKSSVLSSVSSAPALVTSHTYTRPLSYTNTNPRSFSGATASDRDRMMSTTNNTCMRDATNPSLKNTTNKRNTSGRAVPSFYTESGDDYNPYDDTAVPSNDPNLKSEKKVAFQQNDQTDSVSAERRKTEPAISVTKSQFQGLNEDFKRRLEQTIGSANTLPNRPQSQQIKPKEESLYEELPEIPPDHVTYVNDKFNTVSVGFNNDNSPQKPKTQPKHSSHNTLSARSRTVAIRETPPRLPSRTGSMRTTPPQYGNNNKENIGVPSQVPKTPATICNAPYDQKERQVAPSVLTGSDTVPVPPPPPPPPPPVPLTGQPVSWKTRNTGNKHVTFPTVISTSKNQQEEDRAMQVALQRGRRHTEPAVLHVEPIQEPEEFKGTSDKFKRLLESKLGGTQTPSKNAATRKIDDDDDDPYDVIDNGRHSIGQFENSTDM